MTIWVRPQWDIPARGRFHAADVRCPYWEWPRVEGAVRAVLFGFVRCDQLVSGELWHDHAGPGPHLVLVCMVRRDNPGPAYSRLAKMAGPRSKRA